MIESRLRFAIERLFRAENILVARPQRDIHLEASRPIRVQVSPASDDNNAGRQRQVA
jgi:small-conductance mechanosensitive channel